MHVYRSTNKQTNKETNKHIILTGRNAKTPYICTYLYIPIYIYIHTHTYVHIHTNQMLYALCAQAETPRDLAILMLRNQESKAAFCACCDAVCESVICTQATANLKKAMADTRKPHAGKQLNNVCVCVYILICICMYVYL
jgi:hypothetical protein